MTFLIDALGFFAVFGIVVIVVNVLFPPEVRDRRCDCCRHRCPSCRKPLPVSFSPCLDPVPRPIATLVQGPSQVAEIPHSPKPLAEPTASSAPNPVDVSTASRGSGADGQAEPDGGT